MEKIKKNIRKIVDNIIRVVLYIRVSTEEQAKNGYSLDSQLARLKEFCKEKGYKIVNIYTDEGKSARTKLNNRKELLKLINDAKNGEFDRIVFWRLDRWFRNIADYYKVQDILDKYNVDWECSDEIYDTYTANGRLYLNMKLSIAQNESDQTGDRIRFNFDQMVQDKKAIIGTRNCPIGYKVEGAPKQKYIVKNSSDKPFINDLFTTYENSMSISYTTKYLVDKYPNYHFGYQTIRNIITNPLYYGHYRGVDEYCEPYLTKERWDNLQNILKSKNQKQKHGKVRDYIFTGILVCPECNRRLGANGQIRTRPNGEQYLKVTYRCPKHYLDGQCSYKRIIQENMIEEWLLNNYKDLLENYIFQVEEIRDSIAKTDNTTKIAKLEEKINRLNDLYIDGFIDRKKYNTDRLNYTNEINKLKNEKDDISKIDLDKLKKLVDDKKALEIYNRLTVANKRAFWNSFIDKMVFIGNRDYNFTIYLK